MRVLIIGGTKFIGRAITGQFVARGDEVTVVHRGQTEPAGLAESRHLHADRSEFASLAAEISAWRPDAVVDTLALSRSDADAVLPHLPDVPIVVLSSVDVYRAFELLDGNEGGIPVPITEESPLRADRYLYRGQRSGFDDYEKLDVEPAYLARGGVVLRLGFIYGEHDPQLREEFILRRVRAGRKRIPVGTGSWLLSRCYVGDVAAAVIAASTASAASGQVLNVVETASGTVRDWIGQILAAADYDAELVTVPDAVVSDGDLSLTRDYRQHILVDNRKARDLLGWQPADPAAGIAASVRWHLAHPPAGSSPDFTADDRALEAATQ
jgi:nucleoside-diphosphate-sugar epimerase